LIAREYKKHASITIGFKCVKPVQKYTAFKRLASERFRAQTARGVILIKPPLDYEFALCSLTERKTFMNEFFFADALHSAV